MEPIRLSGTGPLVAAIPQLLGYNPTGSIVVVAIKGKMLGVIARLDLPTVAHALRAATTLLTGVVPTEPDALVVVTYPRFPEQDGPVLDVIEVLAKMGGVAVVDRVRVTGDRWRSIDCEDYTCCPLDGKPIPIEAPTNTAIAQARRTPIHADRAALTAKMGEDPARAVSIDPLVEGTVDLDYCMGTVPYFGFVMTGQVERMTAAQVARMAHAVDNIQFRDALVAIITGALPMEALDEQVARVVEPLRGWGSSDQALAGITGLAGAVPDQPEAVNLLAVLANIAYWAGDGAVARTLVDRALHITPEHKLSLLIEMLLSIGVNAYRESAQVTA